MKATETTVLAAYIISSNSASGLKRRSKAKSVTLCQFWSCGYAKVGSSFGVHFLSSSVTVPR